jgi:GT2 family glycosyltransferase
MSRLSASIVIYNENEETLSRVVDNFLQIDLEKELVIVDNSPENRLEKVFRDTPHVKYIFSGQNIGFGSAHNLAFRSLSSNSDIHIIINPDTYFEASDIKEFVLWMHNNKDISLSVPKVCYPDDTLQHTIRNIPTPLTLIKRRLNFNGIFDEFIKKDEFQDVVFDDITEIPFAHGCFFLFQSDVYKKLGGFDERFFMYMEDIDIFIRAKEYGKTVLHPSYKIYHEYRKGSSKNFKLLLWHITSAISFFIKYKS